MCYLKFSSTLVSCNYLSTMPFLIKAASITLIRPFSVGVSSVVCGFWHIIHLLMYYAEMSACFFRSISFEFMKSLLFTHFYLLEIEIKKYTVFIESY